LQAYILINTDPGKLWEVAEAVLKIESVKMSHAVTGQFDVVVYAEFTRMDMLRDLIERLHSLNGVLRTQTAVAIPPRVK